MHSSVLSAPKAFLRKKTGLASHTFLSVSTAEFVSYLWSPGLPQEDLDEESVFGVGRDHDLLDVRVRRALIAAGREPERFSLQQLLAESLHAGA